MFGLFGKPRSLAIVVAALFLVGGAVLATLYFWSPHATLRITIGPEGSQSHRFISGFIKVAKAQHPRIDFATYAVADLNGSARALEQGKVDLAIIRSDVPLPTNGESLVILRRDAVAFILPHHSKIDGLPALFGKTIAIPTGPTQNDNSHTLDVLLSYYNVPLDSVKRIFLPADEIGAALEHGAAAAALAVGPVGPGDAVDVVASVAKATKGVPKLLSFDDDADAIVKRHPGFESLDVPEGGFKAKPQVPGSTTTMLAVNYRIAVPITMLDIVADAIGRSILTAKTQLMSVSPMAAQIEAPDVSDQNPLLPIHPGFAAYLSNGDQSFFDQAQRYLYIFGIPLSIGASLLTLLFSTLNARGSRKDRESVERLLRIASEATTADRERLEALEGELHEAVANCVAQASESGKADQWKTQILMQHAVQRFERREAMLKARAADKPEPCATASDEGGLTPSHSPEPR